MKKFQLIFVWMLMMVLCGCSKKAEPEQQPEKMQEQAEPMEITAFSFTHTGMSTEECFLYSAEQTKEGIRLYTEELFSGGLIVDITVDEPVLEQLGEIADKYQLNKWDGFDKSNQHVMDGNQFSLSVTLTDGKTISAHGNNRFPDGFGDAKQEICELFEGLIGKYANQEPETSEGYEQWYQTILDSNYELIMGLVDDYEYIDGTSGIEEMIMNDAENAADIIGYTFLDVNHDGVTELIVGSISEEKEGKYYGQNIYSAYTYKDTPHLLLEGWSRNRCFLLEDETFYTEGSGGAMYRILENYVLDENGTQLSYKDFYFTKEKDESFEEIGFYHNTTGEWEASASEELEEDVFWSQYDAYGSKTKTLEFTPFAMYQYTGEQTDVASAEAEAVSVEWITEEQLQNSRMQNYVADSTQPQVIAAFYANETIRNLKVLSLTYEEADAMGNTIFLTEELYHYGDFEPGNPFAITLTAYGTIPYYGISYETADGEIHYYAITESGMDGSAILVEFVPKG